jgi:hypothetical protein
MSPLVLPLLLLLLRRHAASWWRNHRVARWRLCRKAVGATAAGTPTPRTALWAVGTGAARTCRPLLLATRHWRRIHKHVIVVPLLPLLLLILHLLELLLLELLQGWHTHGATP